MAISGGDLDSLLNETFPVDGGYLGVNYLSGTETGPIENDFVTSMTVQLNGQPGPGALAGIGESIMVASVDDANDSIGLAVGEGGQSSGVVETEYVIGYQASTGAILLSAFPSGGVANFIAVGATTSTFNGQLGILTPTAIAANATIDFPAINVAGPPGPPSISGATAGQSVTDTSALALFNAVTIADPNSGQTDTVTVTSSAAANGTLTNLGGGSYNATTGVYTVSGTAASVTAALAGLLFTPTPGRAAPGNTVTTNFTIAVTDTAGQSTTNSTTSVTTKGTLLGNLSVSQQLELIYVAYFNRSADGGGYGFWEGQNVTAQNAGQSAALALTNIANSFAPQPETEGLYPSLDPYLVPNPPSLNTPAGQAALSSFISSVYSNLFDRAADQAGAAYWVGQISSGVVGLGAAALAIANGATGTDATEAINKTTVALDFTTRTAAAGLGETSSLPASFAMAAKSVLSGVDGVSLNDASVTTAENATTTYISGSSGGKAAPSSMSLTAEASGSADPDVITISGSNQLIDPGTGGFTIQFLPGARNDTVVVHASGADQISGFDLGSDVLDLSALFGGDNIKANGDLLTPGTYLTIAHEGADALIGFDPTGHGGGGTIAVLKGLGAVADDLGTLVATGVIRIA